jgi:metal-dependent amidase/aminoacylase/carboxypeptidase family protein
MSEGTIDGSVRAQIEAVLPEVVAIRRDIHAQPELGREERRTPALVAQKLRGWGIEVTEHIGGFGVVGTVRGKRPGQDMDALALVEQTSLPYVSTTPGRMHACGHDGHDGHTAMLLGAAKVLAENPDFAGTVQLIFQPAEEGLGGAQAMLEDGLFERAGLAGVLFAAVKLFGHPRSTAAVSNSGDFKRRTAVSFPLFLIVRATRFSP